MNRRTYLKNVLIFGILSLGSFSAYKWFAANKAFDRKKLWSKKQLIAELAETIIPTSETPGAKDASVEMFIINVLIYCTDVKQQKNFLSGLESLESHTYHNYKKDFISCSIREKNEIVQYFSDNTGYSNPLINKINNKLMGEPFYTKLRNLTIEGYCTSAIGATKGLAYDYLPGNFEACTTIKKNQKSWATK